MEQLKIILFLLVWPEGQPQNDPLWTTEPFLTIVECETRSAEMVATAKSKYGAETRTQSQCFSIDNRMKE